MNGSIIEQHQQSNRLPSAAAPLPGFKRLSSLNANGEPQDIRSCTLGKLDFRYTLSNLIFHISENREIATATTTFERPAGLTFGVLLRGKVSFSLDDEPYCVSTEHDGKAKLFAFNLNRTTRWARTTIANNEVCKILVTIPHSWLCNRYAQSSELSAHIKNLVKQHKSSYVMDTDTRLTRLCENILLETSEGVSDLEAEGLALRFISNCIENLSFKFLNLTAPPINTNLNQTPFKIREYLESNIIPSNPPAQPDLKIITKELGYSVSTAQRNFKQAFGLTIIEYIRNRRLEIARDRLAGKMSIGEVAYLAGYNHTSNFSIAFKKFYGLPPGEV